MDLAMAVDKRKTSVKNKIMLDELAKVFDRALKAVEMKRPVEAEKCFHQIFRVKPNWPPARLNYAGFLLKQGKPKDAIKSAQIMLRQREYPTLFSHAYSIIGQAYSKMGNLKKAKEAFQHSIKLKPKSWTLVFLSDVYVSMGHEPESIRCLKEALKLDPKYEEAHYNLGCSYKLSEKLSLAEKHFRKAIAIDPRYAHAHAELGAVLLQKGVKRQGEAVKHLRYSIKLEPNYGWSRLYFAHALWEKEKLHAAALQYQKGIEIWPDSEFMYWAYGDFLSIKKLDNRLAEKYFKKACHLDKKSPQAHYFLGKHFQRIEKLQDAKQAFKRASRLGHTESKRILKEM